MASDIGFVDYVIDQIRTSDAVTYKKMFGEYLIYVNSKPTVLVCDNTAFVKVLDCIKPLMEDAQTGFPYEGAKEHYIVDVDDSELLSKLVEEIEKVTQVPKKRAKK
ncbi:MAG: hypothetical protein LBS73_03835 [Campylobacteraceae bacterium]|jgi:TfoX/Sxy family transcriptional regulator of competence genes|nr:hypothetical protein [Campylobacteraceae bacterium]